MYLSILLSHREGWRSQSLPEPFFFKNLPVIIEYLNRWILRAVHSACHLRDARRSLEGTAFGAKLKEIAGRKEFHALPESPFIYSIGGGDQLSSDPDYPSLLMAALKAVEHGYRVFMLPNPHGVTTPVNWYMTSESISWNIPMPSKCWYSKAKTRCQYPDVSP